MTLDPYLDLDAELQGTAAAWIGKTTAKEVCRQGR